MTSRHALAGLLILSSTAAVFSAETTVPPRSISVAGTHVTRVAPDIVVWEVSTSDFDKDLKKAKDSSDAKLKAIFKLRDELGVKPEDVQTGYLNIGKEYEHEQYGGRGAFKYFSVTRRVTIKQRDIKRFDEFLAKLVGSADIEASYSLESSRFHEIRAETRLKALRIAREKARAMTSEFGVKLGKVLTIDESEPQRYAFWGNREFNFASNDASRAGPVSEDEAEGGTLAPGLIEISVTVKATFEIE